jgi:excisionase family DNA binding protein
MVCRRLSRNRGSLLLIAQRRKSPLDSAQGEERPTMKDASVKAHNLAVMARLLDLKQVAEQLNVGRSTVFDLVGDGRLRSVKIGRRRLVPEAALVEFIESLG